MAVNPKMLSVGIAIMLFAAIQALSFLRHSVSVSTTKWGIRSSCEFLEVPSISFEPPSTAISDFIDAHVSATIRFGKFNQTSNCRLMVAVPANVESFTIRTSEGVELRIQSGDTERVSGIDEPIDYISGGPPTLLVTPNPGETPWTQMNFSFAIPLNRVGFGLYSLTWGFNDQEFFRAGDIADKITFEPKQLELSLGGGLFDGILETQPAPSSFEIGDSLTRKFSLGAEHAVWMLLLLPQLEYVQVFRLIVCLIAFLVGTIAILLAFSRV